MRTKNKGVSRRTFLKGMAAGAVGLAVSAMGCSTETGTTEAESTEAESTGAESTTAETEIPVQEVAEPTVDYKYEIVNTDVLVIGAGNLGIYAAESVVAEGRSVAIIDKGVYRHSGVTGMSWDYFLGKDSTHIIKAMSATKLENAKAYQNAMAFIEKEGMQNRFVYQVNHGQTLPDRDEEGKYVPFLTDDRTQGQFLRRHMDYLIETSRVSVFDRTMVTNFLISNGRCVGAMGIYLPTGDFRVFRANAVIMATGGCTEFYGWRGVSAYSINVPDNTGDAEMAAYRNGAGIINSEFANYDVVSINPEGLSCAFGAGVCGDAQEPQTIFDKDGELLFDLNDERVWTDRAFFCRYMAEQIEVYGRGTENKAIYINVGDTHLRYGNERNIDLLKKFGIDARHEMVEAVPEMFEHGGAPIVDENLMTEIPGLFSGKNFKGGGSVAVNYYMGTYIGRGVAEYIKNNAPENIDFASVQAEIERLEEIRTREREDGLRPHEIRLAIQEVGYQSMGVYRTTEKLEKGIAELTRIREEMMPRMVLADHSVAFNTEWKEAIENYNLLDVAEMSVRASLLREDTRDAYVRAEFPEVDNENWNCALACYDTDGKMEFSKFAYES